MMMLMKLIMIIAMMMIIMVIGIMMMMIMIIITMLILMMMTTRLVRIEQQHISASPLLEPSRFASQDSLRFFPVIFFISFIKVINYGNGDNHNDDQGFASDPLH